MRRNLKINDDQGSYVSKKVEIEKPAMASTPTLLIPLAEPCTSHSAGNARINRTPTPATLLPEDLNDIITDVELQEEADRRLQEEKDAVMAPV